MSDVTIEIVGLRLKVHADSGKSIEISLNRTWAQVLAAGLRANAGVINKDDRHLAAAASMVFGTEIKAKSASTRPVRLGGAVKIKLPR